MAVEYSREGSVGYITLDKPPANSYELSFMKELGAKDLPTAGRQVVDLGHEGARRVRALRGRR